MAYVGCDVVIWSVTEVGDDRIGAEEQVGRNTVDGGLTKALTRFAEMLVSGVNDGLHTRD